MTSAILQRLPWLSRWGADSWSFNVDVGDDDGDVSPSDSDGSGNPGRGLVGAAMARWAMMAYIHDPAAVAIAFNVPLACAQDAFRPDLFPPSDVDEALQVWSMLVGATASIDLAASVFGLTPVAVRRAIAHHTYLFTAWSEGVEMFVHEGE